MLQIPINRVPNQTLQVILDGNAYIITLKATDQQTSVSMTRNGAVVFENLRAVAGGWIIPSEYEEAGNFFFTTQSFQYPEWSKYANTQFLIYASPAELKALRAPIAPPVRAVDFNPIAALPLRFAPMGY